MAGYQSRNSKVIAKAFSRLASNEERIIGEGLRRLALTGLAFLVEAHDLHPIAHHHPEENDTMAYAVARDGKVFEAGAFSGGESVPNSNAESKARGLVAGMPGWAAVILSDMGRDWYRVDWEMQFLQYSADQIRDNFHKIFIPAQ